MTGVVARPYTAQDRAACLRIFDSNVPTYFARHERTEFDAFLGALGPDSPYLVLIAKGDVVACGGIEIEAEAGRAGLSWGMVDRAFHGQGLGRSLTAARSALAQKVPGLSVLTLATSQKTGGFYAGFGFVVTQVTPDGFGPGLDRWDMRLSLGPS